MESKKQRIRSLQKDPCGPAMSHAPLYPYDSFENTRNCTIRKSNELLPPLLYLLQTHIL